MSRTSRTYLITGANRGIGLGLARALHARGSVVVPTCRDPGGAKALRALGLEPRALDVADPASIQALSAALRSELPAIDVLINNAGVNAGAFDVREDARDVLSLTPEAFLGEMRINAVGPMLVARALLPLLRAGERPIVLNISSQLGAMENGMSMGSDIGYNASKAALNMITRALAGAQEASGITCLAVHPGWVRTDMGGTRAPLEIEDAVKGLLRILDDVKPEQNGSFLDWRGQIHPW